jgi:hypothetical protein
MNYIYVYISFHLKASSLKLYLIYHPVNYVAYVYMHVTCEMQIRFLKNRIRDLYSSVIQFLLLKSHISMCRKW